MSPNPEQDRPAPPAGPDEGSRARVATGAGRRDSAESGTPSDHRTGPGTEHDSQSEESDLERAEELAREVGEENPDPTTRREAIEQALAEEGLSEEGEEIGQHND